MSIRERIDGWLRALITSVVTPIIALLRADLMVEIRQIRQDQASLHAALLSIDQRLDRDEAVDRLRGDLLEAFDTSCADLNERIRAAAVGVASTWDQKARVLTRERRQ